MGNKTRKMGKKAVISVLFLTFCVLQAPIAQASLVFKMSPKEMTKVAKEVRMGEVVSTWTSPHPVNKMIYTYVKIRVNQTFKGQERSEILLRQPGGTYTYPENKQTYRQKVFGMQTFEKGEKGIFFIDYDKDGAPNVMFQGKHKILRDPTTDQEQAYESFSRDVKYVDQELQPVQSKHSMFAKQEVRNLGALIDEINQAVEEERKGQHP